MEHEQLPAKLRFLKILITNAYLATYGGTQVVVRDLACELTRQGHQVAVYCPRLGLWRMKSEGMAFQLRTN